MLTHMPLSRAARTLALALTCLVCSLALTACVPTFPTEPPGITGHVVSVVAGDGRPASMNVESSGTPAPGAVSDKALVNIPPNTMFFDAQGFQASPQLVASIAPATVVRVWFTGPVAESYPVQGSAKAVQILGK